MSPAAATRPILPGGRIGVLGSGQLGRMFAIAARRLGYRVATYSPDSDTPMGQVADLEIVAPYSDLDALRAFASRTDAITFEFENIPSESIEAIAEIVPVRPAGAVLHTAQNRLREKRFLEHHGIPVTAFRDACSAPDLKKALAELHAPAILKTAGWGYDGKGQIRIDEPAEAEAAWNALNVPHAVLEAVVDFQCELSVVAARGVDGAVAVYDVFENAHSNHILDVTACPARIPPETARQAQEIARAIMEALDVTGVLCTEFFLTKSGKLLVNELAPRPHNSGHLTIDAAAACQFEQQVRAVCGLPLGSPALHRPAAMANLLGDLWDDGPPNFEAALSYPDVKLHLYGKAEARPGRKMGHLTVLADTPDAAIERIAAARRALAQR